MFRCIERMGKKRASVAAAVAVGLGACVVIEPAAAQGDPALEVDVADCVEIESPAERFRCYESRVDSALREQSGDTASASGNAARGAPPDASRDARPSGASAPRAAAAASSAPRGAGASNAGANGQAARPAARAAVPEVDAAERSFSVDDFGLRPPDEEDEDQKEQQQELFGTVADMRETVPNSYLITLENGQVWRQMRPKFYPLRVGSRVRIYSTRWGSSYRMSSDELNGFIQVERVR